MGKESAYSAGDPVSIPGSGRFPREGNDNPLQYSCLENPMDRGVWWVTVHGVTRVGHDLATKPPPPPLILKLQYFDLMQKADSLEKALILRKFEGKEEWGRGQRMRSLDSITDSVDINLSRLSETEEEIEAWSPAVHEVAKN